MGADEGLYAGGPRKMELILLSASCPDLVFGIVEGKVGLRKL